MDEEFALKVRRIKERAAMRAFIEYAKVFSESFSLEELKQIAPIVDGTSHLHDALLEMEGADAVYVRCRWDFRADPEFVAAARVAALAAVDKTTVSY